MFVTFCHQYMVHIMSSSWMDFSRVLQQQIWRDFLKISETMDLLFVGLMIHLHWLYFEPHQLVCVACLA